MKVQLQTQDIRLPRNGARQLVRRCAQLFPRLTGHIARLHVTLKDTNGPRGGNDKVCIMRAELEHGGEVLVRDTGSSLRGSISRCARRLRSLVKKKSEKRRVRRRGSRRGGVLA